MITKINETSFAVRKNGTDIEIGDVTQSEFYPQVKSKHWGNECNYSIRLTQSINGGQLTSDDTSVTWQRGTITAKFYETNGDIQFDITISAHPGQNTLDFTIESKGLIALYQDIPTQAELDLGMQRPSNVIGSYAFYHQSKTGGRYQTGKAFHWFTPKVTDNLGSWQWCTLFVNGNSATITIPQSFIDSATYPIVIQ